MTQLLNKTYWSKAEAFLLPLTGLPKDSKYDVNAYLFWDDYTIDNYQLIMTISYNNYEEFLAWSKEVIFPILDKNGYATETYDCEGMTVFILDMSEWAWDIEQFLSGKYSKLSEEAKMYIKNYHKFGDNNIPLYIYSVIYPEKKMAILNDNTPLEFMIEHYQFVPEDVHKIGEIGSAYDKEAETLHAAVCHNDREMA